MATVPIPQGATIGEQQNTGAVPIPQGATIGAHTAPPTQDKGLLQKAGDYFTPVTDALQGVGAGALQTANSLGAIPLKAVSAISKATGGEGLPASYTDMGAESSDVTKPPDSIAGKAGNMIENIAEYAIGEGEAKALTYAGKLRETAHIAAFLEKYPKLGSLLGNAIVNQGVGTTQGLAKGEDLSQAAKEGAAGAGIGTLGEAILPQLDKFSTPLADAAKKQYAKILNPTTAGAKYETANVVPRLLEDKQLITSGKALEDKAAGKTAEIGSQIGEAVQNVPEAVKPKVQNVVDAIKKYKDSFIVDGVPINEDAVKHADTLAKTMNEFGNDISYQSLNRVRQILDTSVAQSKGYLGKTLSEGSKVDVQKEAANAIRGELAKASPDIAKLNAEFHFWRQTEDVIGATNARKVGQQGSVGRVFAPIAGAGLGTIMHNSPAEIAGWAATLSVANEIIRSPLWNSASAITKNELAKALASNNAAKVSAIAQKFTPAAAAAIERQNESSK